MCTAPREVAPKKKLEIQVSNICNLCHRIHDNIGNTKIRVQLRPFQLLYQTKYAFGSDFRLQLNLSFLSILGVSDFTLHQQPIFH